MGIENGWTRQLEALIEENEMLKKIIEQMKEKDSLIRNLKAANKGRGEVIKKLMEG